MTSRLGTGKSISFFNLIESGDPDPDPDTRAKRMRIKIRNTVKLTCRVACPAWLPACDQRQVAGHAAPPRASHAARTAAHARQGAAQVGEAQGGAPPPPPVESTHNVPRRVLNSSD